MIEIFKAKSLNEIFLDENNLTYNGIKRFLKELQSQECYGKIHLPKFDLFQANISENDMNELQKISKFLENKKTQILEKNAFLLESMQTNNMEIIDEQLLSNDSIDFLPYQSISNTAENSFYPYTDKLQTLSGLPTEIQSSIQHVNDELISDKQWEMNLDYIPKLPDDDEYEKIINNYSLQHMLEEFEQED